VPRLRRDLRDTRAHDARADDQHRRVRPEIDAHPRSLGPGPRNAGLRGAAVVTTLAAPATGRKAMRYLVVGAGALGGYFGGRLLEAGRDVTFLLRPGRAQALARTGLVIRSRFGDATLAAPPSVLKEDLRTPFDVVVVGCKAYDLAETMDAFAPAVGPQTAILPLLNGMAHFDALTARFGAERVLGGLCMISAALDAAGAVQHFNDFHVLVFGSSTAACRRGSRRCRRTAPAPGSTPASPRRCASSCGRSGSSSRRWPRSPA
jgi:hypothetical protein